jgi:lipopolysaccharide export system protein LptA
MSQRRFDATQALLRVLAVPLATALWLLAGSANAEKADHDKPTNIVYDHANWDDLKQIYIFTGNVILTKGTILVRCDNLNVRQDPEGYDFAIATMDSTARQVFFRQKREGYADQYIEGVGDRIEYDEKKDEVTIFTRAVVKRLEAEVPQDEMRGDTIEYNSLTEKYHIESGSKGQQGHATFAPAKPAPGATPGAPGATPGTPGATPGTPGAQGTAPAAGGAKPPAAPAAGTNPPGSSVPGTTGPRAPTDATKAANDPGVPLKPAGAIGTTPYD